jgi:hypothetical protein
MIGDPSSRRRRNRGFPQELIVQPKSWMESYYKLQRLTYFDAGGHYAPAEQREALVHDIRAFFRPMRFGP